MTNLYVPTFTGKRVDLLNPNPDDIDIRDIAHSLALCNRYLGVSIRPYCVGEHSVRLAHVAGVLLPHPAWNCLEAASDYTPQREGLMHDGHEAYTWDLPRMIVDYLGSTYGSLRVGVDTAIRNRYGLESDMDSELKRLDKAICRVEIASGLFWNQEMFHHVARDPEFNGTPNDAQRITKALDTFDSGEHWYNTRPDWGWDWQYAERRFLEAAAQYGVE